MSTPVWAQEVEQEKESEPGSSEGETQKQASPSAADGEQEQEPAEGDKAAGEGDLPQPEVTMPEVLQRTEPLYPAEESGDAQVVLLITLDAEGQITDLSVAQSGGAAFDQAAQDAVRSWKFSPATRDGQKVAARVKLAVPFVEAETPVAEKEEAAQPSDSNGSQQAAVDLTHKDSHLSVTVHGDRVLRSERRSAGDYFMHREVLEAAPHAEGVDMLQLAPGLTMARGEGVAVAHSYNLRGFDAAHGQDIEFHVGGLPINLPSHVHGQGYADLNFLIGDVVDELHITEGVSDPDQGDFAVAGSIDIDLGVDEAQRGLSLRSSYGSFKTFRQSMVWAPKGGERESFGAAQFTTTGGYGENRSAKSGSAIVQHRFGEGSVRYRAIGLVHAARGDHAGNIRREDIDSGEVCFHCAYDDTSARAQNGMNQRLMAGVFADYQGEEHASGSLGLWLGYDNFRTQFNSTGYVQRSQTLPGVYGLGDLFEQHNQTSSVGLLGRYRTEAYEPSSWAHGTIEVGVDGRYDNINQEQNLIDAAARNSTWDERIDAQITGLSLAMWGDLDWQLAKVFNLRVGARAALISYEVDDRLGNYAPSSRPQDQRIDGFRRSSLGLFAGPRASVEYKVLRQLSLLSSYGEGYRSPQARTLEEGEDAPFARVRSADVGARFRLTDRFVLSGVAYLTHLSEDVVFDPTEGSLERVGATLRRGVTVYARTRPTDWLLSSLSFTYVHATLQEPPPATAQDPNPPYSKGQRLPYVPPIVIRLDNSIRQPLIQHAGAFPLIGVAGLGFTFRSARPLPYSQMGDPWTLLDASLGVEWGPLDFSVAGYNLLNQNYAAEQYFYSSQWSQDSPNTRVPAEHLAAGAPLSVMATLGLTL